MRMFVAVEPSDPAREHLEEFLDVRRHVAAFRWTDPDHLHVTLAFLEQVPDHRLDDLALRLEVAAARRRTFSAAVAGGGAFPHVGEARVLYAGLEVDAAGAEQLDRLAQGVRNAAATSGIEVDGRRFHPHLTVARLGRPAELSRWVRLLDGYRGPAFEVSEVSLVASHLGEGRARRPRHEVVGTFPLGPAPAPGTCSHQPRLGRA